MHSHAAVECSRNIADSVRLYSNSDVVYLKALGDGKTRDALLNETDGLIELAGAREGHEGVALRKICRPLDPHSSAPGLARTNHLGLAQGLEAEVGLMEERLELGRIALGFLSCDK